MERRERRLARNYPIANSSGDSSGVPHTRQITAEQSPQVSGSVTSREQVGQYNSGGVGVSAINRIVLTTRYCKLVTE
jgi:hypothetical protein